MPHKKIWSICVAGGGSWGTALAHLLAGTGHRVVLWARNAELVEHINKQHENPRYLPGRALHHSLVASTDLACLGACELLLLAVPCQQQREFLSRAKSCFKPGIVLVNAAKGIENTSLLTMSRLAQELLPQLDYSYVMLSGPSFAAELLDGQPTAVVLACEDEALGARLRQAFSTESFRCYSSTDVCGVELGGALKNVLAIAVGLCDGLGLGGNPRAALLTRGLAEMSRFGEAFGARPSTFMGLSGLGDLVLTCTGDLSRNRRVGLALARGQSLDEIVQTLGSVAEGVATSLAVHKLASEHGVEMPVSSVVHAIIQGQCSPGEAVRGLMLRQLKGE